MCGIAGKVDWEKPIPAEVVREMRDALYHRGPDAAGLQVFGHAVFGHRRLSILDLSEKGNQPMSTPDGRYCIVYNGEVYNFQEIRAELESDGIGFLSTTDTEVVLYAYRKWGPECLLRFNGMFAFAVWDEREQSLFLARDRFGKKPLYYYISESGSVSFASELSALLHDRSVPRVFSYEALNCYLAIGYILSPQTLYRDVSKLEPGSYLSISNRGAKRTRSRYWDYAGLFRTKTTEDEKTIAERTGELLERAVKRRMISDVPIGAFLSGGVDSSSVVALMKRYHRGDLHTFSIGFDQKSYSELDDADRAAGAIGTLHHTKVCRVDEERAVLDGFIDAFDEPFADTSLIPMIEVSRLAREQVTVVLSGDGADEIFAGYITYKADRFHGYSTLVPRSIRHLLSRLQLPHGKSPKKLGWRYKQKQFLYGSLHSPEKAHYLWRIMFRPEERVAILGPEHRDLVYDSDPFRVFERFYADVEGLHWLDRHLYVDAMTWLTDDILVKLDRTTMFTSLESRAPFLDPELAAYAASIPAELKLKGLKTKYILKKALRDIVPDFVLTKKKSGFNAPVGAWIGFDGLDEFKSFNEYVFRRKVTLN